MSRVTQTKLERDSRQRILLRMPSTRVGSKRALKIHEKLIREIYTCSPVLLSERTSPRECVRHSCSSLCAELQANDWRS
eukprot:6466808-Amphidinium_carterae.1